MHHCLQIEEILASIFEFVLTGVGTRKTYDKRSVLALVKTCRNFNVPALQVLWKNLFSPVPLFLTMPEDLWQVEESVNPLVAPRTLSLKREIQPEDWQRFDIYASFVRHLGVIEMQGRSPMNFISFGDGVRRQLESRTPAVSLLPNLRTVVAWTNDLPLTSLFLTPRVHHLKLVMHPGHVAALSSLALEVPLHSPNLRSLHLVESTGSIWNVSHKAQFIDALTELLENLKLEEFICNWFPLSEVMLSAVLGMPDLSTVAIYATMPDLAQVMHTHPIQDVHIRRFALYTPLLVPSQLPHIISSLHPSKLKALCITARCTSCNTKELTAVISTLVNTCSPKHLTEFYIDSGRHDPVDVAAAAIDFKMLKPLLQFVHLRRISLPSHPFDLTDTEVKDMALAWPNLEDLYYWAYKYPPPEGSTNTGPRTSLRGLLWLATLCPKLITLTFPFRSSSVDAEFFTEDEMALAEGHHLNILDVGFSEIESAEQVALFINTVFPNLTLLVFRVGQPYYGRWEKVQELIQHS